MAERGHVLGDGPVEVLREAVGGDRARVDQPLGARRDRRLEDVARALDVDVARLAAGLEDDEGEVHDHVGALDEPLDRRAVEHVAAAVLGALPAVGGGVEGPARHADDAPDLARALQRADEGAADLARRAGDRDGEAGHQLACAAACAGSATRCGRSTQTPRSSSRSPRTWKPRRPGASAHRQARPGSIGAPTGSASTRTRPASRSARTGTRTANGKPSGPTKARTASGWRAPSASRRSSQTLPPPSGGAWPTSGSSLCAERTSSTCASKSSRLGLEVAAGPHVDALGQHVDVDLRSAAAVLGVRGALHEDHGLDVGEQQRDADVGLRARDGHVDAALGRLVARRQRPHDGLAAAVDRHVVGGGRPPEDLEELCRQRPLHGWADPSARPRSSPVGYRPPRR